jgi:hypothetical protein
MNGPDFRKSLKNRRARSTSLEINQLSVPKQHVSFCTSLTWAGCRIASIILIFSGLASIPRCETRKPSSLPAMTPNIHLFGFILVRVAHNLSKTKVRLSNRDACDLIFTTMSLTYTYTKSLIRSPNVLCMTRTKVGRALRP